MRRWIIIYVVLTFVVCLGYTFYTGHIWEDYYITFRHSRNLATGHGLVYQPGERVHGFTSPINTLLPAVFDYLAGSKSPMPALWMYRIASIAALAGGGVFIMRLFLQHDRASWIAPVALIVLTLTDLKIIAYTTNGQEAGFMVLFLAWSIACLHRGHTAAWLGAGLAWAGLMYTRPDGCVYIAALGGVALLTTAHTRRREFVGLLKAAAVCTAAYLPWVIWATWYYGSFVPHTVTAKSGSLLPTSITSARLVKTLIYKWFDSAGMTFEPIYMRLGGWPGWVELLCLLVGLLAAGLSFWGTRDRLMRITSSLFILMCAYMSYVGLNGAPVMPWYLPPLAFLALVTLARMPVVFGRTGAVGAGVMAVGAGALLLLGSYQIRIQQHEIEDNTRTKIGLWLRDHVAPGEIVHLEPLGYIGFFSEADMQDWPGLVSPRVVALRRGPEQPNQATIVPHLKPDWLVIRPLEERAMARIEAITSAYRLVKEFDARPRLETYGWIPGKDYLLCDAEFRIYRRREDTPREDQ